AKQEDATGWKARWLVVLELVSRYGDERKEAKKTVDDDEKLRHNLTSLLLMQRRRKRSDGAVTMRRSEVRSD
ncbi:hypothetical protein, partial [Pandoraea pneumonica]